MTTSTSPASAGQLELPLPSNLPQDWTEYARWVDGNTDKRADANRILYAITGLSTEVGELMDHVEKFIRTGGERYWDIPKITHEAGDVLYYLTKLANDLGTTLEHIRDCNIIKLEDRKINGKRTEGAGVTK